MTLFLYNLSLKCPDGTANEGFRIGLRTQQSDKSTSHFNKILKVTPEINDKPMIYLKQHKEIIGSRPLPLEILKQDCYYTGKMKFKKKIELRFNVYYQVENNERFDSQHAPQLELDPKLLKPNPSEENPTIQAIFDDTNFSNELFFNIVQNFRQMNEDQLQFLNDETFLNMLSEMVESDKK